MRKDSEYSLYTRVATALAVGAVALTGRAEAHEGHKLDICHVPPGNPENAHVNSVDLHAWENGHTPHNNHDMDFRTYTEDDDPRNDKPCPPLINTPIPEEPTATTTPNPDRTATPSTTPTSTGESTEAGETPTPSGTPYGITPQATHTPPAATVEPEATPKGGADNDLASRGKQAENLLRLLGTAGILGGAEALRGRITSSTKKRNS